MSDIIQHLHFFPIIYEPILGINLIFILLVLFSKKNPAKTLSWVLVLYFMPAFGILLYLFLGINWRKRSVVQQLSISNSIFPHNSIASEVGSFLTKEEVSKKRSLFNIARITSKLPVFSNNQVTIYNETNQAFEAMLNDIMHAKHHIHLEFYIFKPDETGKKLKESLLKKANEDIFIKIVVDAYGSHYTLNKKFFKELENHPYIRVSAFQPVKFPYVNLRANYRNHRKLIVIDGNIAHLGGMNIGDEYLGKNQRLGYWKDTVIRINGDSVKNMQTVFLQDWYFSTKEKIARSKQYFPDNSAKPAYGDKLIQVVSSSPLSNWDTIHQLYFESIASAETSLYITTPYFIPDDALLMALKTAALGGTDVKLLVPGKADHLLTFLATSSYLEDVLNAGIEVYLYDKTSFIHSKTITVDGVFASIGSANMDQRSMNINFEMNALLYDRELVAKLNEDFLKDIKNSQRLTLDDIKKKSLIIKTVESAVRLLSPIL